MSSSSDRLTNEQLLEVFSQTKTATAIHIGEDAIIQTANDAMLRIWGKDKSVIGKSLEDALPELKGQPFIEMFKKVWNEGLVISGNDTAAELVVDGILQKFYFDFEYRAIKNNDGKTICILHTAMDVTERFLKSSALEIAREREEILLKDLQAVNEELAASNEELAASNEELMATNEELADSQETLQTKINELALSEARFRYLVEQAPIAITVLKSRDLIIDIVNEKMLEIWGKTPAIHNTRLADAMPELEGQPFLQILDDVLTSGEPYFGYESYAHIMRNGKLVDGYFNFICQPIKDETGQTTSVLQVVIEITEQVNARIKLQHTEEMMRLAMESAQAATWHINAKTRAFTGSPRLKEIYGYHENEQMAFDVAVAQIPDDYRQAALNEFNNALSSGAPFDIEYPLTRFNDQQIRWVKVTGKLSYDGNGNPSELTGLVQDITERKQDEQRKNDFIAMVSHELKTPLTSLKAYIQLVHGKALKTDDIFTTGALDKANKQVARMTTMINGFLNVSRLESGKIYIDKQRFDIKDLMKEIEEESLTTTSSHKIIFQPVESNIINADRDKISQVMNNFINNAVKYSPAGSTIIVVCKIVNSKLQLSVKDEGMGISTYDSSKIFDRFYRVANNSTISGFGIGLYLSAEIIYLHNGNIWVESELQKGSTFYFNLPIE